MKILPLTALALVLPLVAHAADYTVAPVSVTDYKPVFATVESVDVSSARARIGGTLVDLRVDEGSRVTQGQVIAVVGDAKLGLQLSSSNAQVAAAQAQQGKARDDYARAQELFKNGTIAKARLDDAKAAFEVADNQLKSAIAQRAVIDQQMQEGQILSPAAGLVLDVPVSKGSVLMPGEVAARIAAESYILRLQLPERYAQSLQVGGLIHLDDGRTGTLRQIYPLIAQGRVQADAEVADLGGYFVGQRVRVMLEAGIHQGFVVPPAYITTRAGLDYVHLRAGDQVIDVPVQRGESQKDGIEILSGLAVGDILIETGK